MATALGVRRLELSNAASSLLERGLQPTRLPVLSGWSSPPGTCRPKARGRRRLVRRVLAPVRRPLAGDRRRRRPRSRRSGRDGTSQERLARVRAARRIARAGAGTYRPQGSALRDRHDGDVGLRHVAAVRYDQMRICTAGHPPPVLAVPVRQPISLICRRACPRSYARASSRASIEIAWPAGSAAVLHRRVGGAARGRYRRSPVPSCCRRLVGRPRDHVCFGHARDDPQRGRAR